MKTLLITTAALFAFILTCQAEDVPEAVAKQCEVLLRSTQENDLNEFKSVCDEAMREAITEAKLKQVSDQVAPLMKSGYKKTFMGSVDRLNHKTYYWKMTFDTKDVGEILVQLTSANGKVSGFFMQ